MISRVSQLKLKCVLRILASQVDAVPSAPMSMRLDPTTNPFFRLAPARPGANVPTFSSVLKLFHENIPKLNLKNLRNEGVKTRNVVEIGKPLDMDHYDMVFLSGLREKNAKRTAKQDTGETHGITRSRSSVSDPN